MGSILSVRLEGGETPDVARFYKDDRDVAAYQQPPSKLRPHFAVVSPSLYKSRLKKLSAKGEK